MVNTVDAVNEMIALCDKTAKEMQQIFDEMPGDIMEKCTGMWGYRPCGSSENPSDKSRSSSAEKTEKAEKKEEKRERIKIAPSLSFASTQDGVSTRSSSGSSRAHGMSASTVSSATGNSVFDTIDTTVHCSVDKKQLFISYWMESEKPVDDDEMRELEKALLG